MILRFEDLDQTELEQILEDKIKTLRKLEAKIEKLYEIGDDDYAGNLDMICDVIIDDIREIENLLGVNQ